MVGTFGRQQQPRALHWLHSSTLVPNGGLIQQPRTPFGTQTISSPSTSLLLLLLFSNPAIIVHGVAVTARSPAATDVRVGGSVPAAAASVLLPAHDALSRANGFASDADAVAAFTGRSDGTFSFAPDTGWSNCPNPKYEMTKPGTRHTKFRTLQIAQTMRAAGREQLKDFATLAHKQAVDSKVVLTFAGDNYYNTVMNWLHSMSSVGVTNVVVFSIDAELHAKLQDIGVASYYSKDFLEHMDEVFLIAAQRKAVNEKPGLRMNANFRRSALKQVMLGRLWCMRMVVIRTLLEAGLSVVQSDSDAVPLQNPFPLLARAPGDIVAQRGVFPQRVSEDWTGIRHDKVGYSSTSHHGTLCFGFIMYRSTPATLALIDLAWTLMLVCHAPPSIQDSFLLSSGSAPGPTCTNPKMCVSFDP